jgi:DNA-directed RNA polymerase subunit L
MKSCNKKKGKTNEELVLEIEISKEDGTLFKRLKKIITTHKLPTK